MASITITLAHNTAIAQPDVITWVPFSGSLPSLGTELSESGNELYLGVFTLPRLTNNPLNLQLSDPETEGPGNAGDAFTTQMETSGSITCLASDGESVVITGIDDTTEPYTWTPTNIADILVFTNHVASLSDHSLTMTFDDSAAPATPATITDQQITSNPVALSDTYGFNETVEFTITFDVAVDVEGSPQLPINFGQSPSGSPEFAEYSGGDGSSTLTFTWTVSATDLDTNGIFLYGSSRSINLNGGTIRNANTSTDADLTLIGGGTESGHKVDGSLSALSAPSFSDDTGNAQSWTQDTPITPLTVPAASGVPTPTYSVIGSLPAGINFSPSTRVISGTPTTIGSGTITIRATNSEGMDDWTVTYTTITALTAPVFANNTGTARTWTVGVQIVPLTVPSATGNPTPTYSVVGSLPTGIQFSTATRVISGTPTIAGSGTITIRATNSEGDADWTVAYTTELAMVGSGVTITLPHDELTIQSQGTLGQVALRWGIIGFADDQSLDNLSLGTELSSNGVEIFLGGIGLPTTRNASTLVFLYLANSATGGIIPPGPNFSNAMRTSGTITLTASDGDSVELQGITDLLEPYIWTPSNSDAQREFTDHVVSLADRTLTVNFNDNLAPGATEPSVPAAPTIADLGPSYADIEWVAPDDGGSPILYYKVQWRQGTTGNFTTVEVPDTQLLYNLTGLTSGFLHQVRVNAGNSQGESAYSSITEFTPESVAANVAPSFATNTWPAQNWALNEAITTIIVHLATGIPTPTYSVIGSLPPGITFNPNTRNISGTPTAIGSGTITIRASNSEGDADWTVDYSIIAPASITNTQITSTPQAASDTYGLDEIIEFTVTYDTPIDVIGAPRFPMNIGQSPSGTNYADYSHDTSNTIVFTWTVASTDRDTNGIFLVGASPPIDLNNGAIRNSGTLINASLATTNRGTQSGHKVDGSLGVITNTTPAFADDTGDDQTWVVGNSITSITVPAASGTPTPNYSVIGSLPPGITFNSNTRVISGTPTSTGSGTITINAANSEGSDTWTLNYTIQAAVTAPDTPTTPTISGITKTQATLAWIAPYNGGSPITSYTLQWRLGTSGSFTTISNITTTSHTILNLTTDTTYQAQVRATNSIGSSSYSPLLTFDTPSNVAPTITISANRTTGSGGSLFRLSSTVSDPDHPQAQLTYAWTAAPDVGTFSATDESHPSWRAHMPTDQTQVIITCTVTDPDNLTGTASITLTVLGQTTGVGPTLTPIPDSITSITGFWETGEEITTTKLNRTVTQRSEAPGHAGMRIITDRGEIGIHDGDTYYGLVLVDTAQE